MLTCICYHHILRIRQVVANNVLELMRFVPQYVPWVGRPLPSLQALVSSSSLLAPSGGNHTVTLLSNITAGGTQAGDKLGGMAAVGVFFGAAWSQPSKEFIPLLQAAQSKLGSDAKTEIVFVSLDQSEEEFERFRKQVPFLAIPFNDRRRALLQLGLNVKAIPSLGECNDCCECLLAQDLRMRHDIFTHATNIPNLFYNCIFSVVFLSNNSVVSTTGVSDVLGEEPFACPRPVQNLSSGASIEKLRHSPVLIAFVENCTVAVQEEVREALSALNDDLRSAPDTFPQASRSNLLLSYMDKSGELSKLLRKLVQVPAEDSPYAMGNPQFAILDLATENISASMSLGQSTEIADRFTNGVDMKHVLQRFVDKYQTYQLKTSSLKTTGDVGDQPDSESAADEGDGDDHASGVDDEVNDFVGS